MGKIIAGIVLAGIAGVIVLFVIVVIGLRAYHGHVAPWSEDIYDTHGKTSLALQSSTKGAGMASREMPMNSIDATMDVSMDADVNNAEVAQDKKEIKDGQIYMRVDRVDNAVAAITAIAEQYGGSVVTTSFTRRTDDVKSGTVTVHVPVAQFADAFTAIKKVATVVTQESTGSEDVTLAYRDLEKRIANAMAEEQAYIKVLDQAKKISDILEVTRQVQRVRGDIERMQAQLTFMASQTDYARITVTLSEDRTVTLSDQWRPLQIVKEGMHGLFVDMQGFVNLLIILIVRIVPMLVMYGVLLWLVVIAARGLWRAVRRRRTTSDRTRIIN